MKHAILEIHRNSTDAQFEMPSGWIEPPDVEVHGDEAVPIMISDALYEVAESYVNDSRTSSSFIVMRNGIQVESCLSALTKKLKLEIKEILDSWSLGLLDGMPNEFAWRKSAKSLIMWLMDDVELPPDLVGYVNVIAENQRAWMRFAGSLE